MVAAEASPATPVARTAAHNGASAATPPSATRTASIFPVPATVPAAATLAVTTQATATPPKKRRSKKGAAERDLGVLVQAIDDIAWGPSGAGNNRRRTRRGTSFDPAVRARATRGSSAASGPAAADDPGTVLAASFGPLPVATDVAANATAAQATAPTPCGAVDLLGRLAPPRATAQAPNIIVPPAAPQDGRAAASTQQVAAGSPTTAAPDTRAAQAQQVDRSHNRGRMADLLASGLHDDAAEGENILNTWSFNSLSNFRICAIA